MIISNINSIIIISVIIIAFTINASSTISDQLSNISVHAETHLRVCYAHTPNKHIFIHIFFFIVSVQTFTTAAATTVLVPYRLGLLRLYTKWFICRRSFDSDRMQNARWNDFHHGSRIVGQFYSVVVVDFFLLNYLKNNLIFHCTDLQWGSHNEMWTIWSWQPVDSDTRSRLISKWTNLRSMV